MRSGGVRGAHQARRPERQSEAKRPRVRRPRCGRSRTRRRFLSCWLLSRTPAAHADAKLTAALDDAEQALDVGSRRHRDVHAIGSASPLRPLYPVSDYYSM